MEKVTEIAVHENVGSDHSVKKSVGVASCETSAMTGHIAGVQYSPNSEPLYQIHQTSCLLCLRLETPFLFNPSYFVYFDQGV